MKKRLLSVLLLVCMVLTLLPTAALAGDVHEHEALPAAAHTHCFCGGSVNAGDHTSHENVTYTACTKWNTLKNIFFSPKRVDVAYAYLENDITLEDYNLSIQDGHTLYLCLNGHTLNLGEYTILVGSHGAKLYLCDCSADKTGTVSGGSTCCVSLYDAADYEATFNMYGGTLRGGNRTGHGGGVNVELGTINMYGGTITENTATTDGGGIYVGTKGTLNLYGGTITKNTINTNEARHGGGVYVESNYLTGAGTISISGSPVITGNTRVYTNASTGAQTTSTENLYLAYGFYNSGQFPTITLGTLTSGANIGIWAGESVFSTASDTDYSGYFSSDVDGYHVEYNTDKKLELKAGAAHVHTGGTATCTELAVCSECHNPYGPLDPNNHSGTLGEWQSNDDNHWKEYSCCHAHAEEGTHTGGTADCQHKAVCDICKTEYGSLGDHSFTAETAADQYLKSAADCEHAAVYYKSCTVCGLSSAGAADEATFESGVALDHDWRAWTSNGDGTHTRTCKRDASHTETGDCTGGTADCLHEAVCDICKTEYGDLASHNFTAETVDGKYLKSAADCEHAAVYYKSCTGCSMSSEGMPGEATFTYGDPLDHDMSEPSYAWKEVPDGYMCVAFSKCKNCDFDVADVASVSYAVTTAPTCLNEGTGTYTATFSTAYGFPAQTKTVTLPATGHSWGEPEYIWTETEDGYDCTAKRVCKNDGTHVEDETVIAAYSVITKPTCLTTGLGRYYAAFAADWATAGATKEVTLAALGHAFGDWTSNGNGTHTRVCANDHTHTETGNCTGGTATCTAKAICKTCGSAYGAKDPNNHTGRLAWDITETHHEQAWTCCGLITVAKAAHTFGDWVVTKRPTSREEGEKARTCSVCGYTETKVLPKTGGGPTYYTLVFESNGGSKITNVNERHGTVVDLTLAKYQPTRTGYDFTGWYSDKALTRRVTSVKLYENTTVYAGWSTRELPFADVGRGDWFFDDVRYVYETGLMNGVSATRFAPYGSTTRGMIVTILYRMEGQPAVSRGCPFTDVASGSYYERAITWAAANGIVTGHSGTIFAPDASVTREQLAAILYRYAVYKGLDVSVGENTNILSYEDFASLSEYAIPAMQWACGAGVLYGFGGSLLPDAPANRLQAAAILHRFCVNILN